MISRIRLTKRVVSPARLFVTTWFFTLIAAYLGPAEEVYQVHGVRTTFTTEGMLWISACIIVFLAGVAAANRKKIRFSYSRTELLGNTDENVWKRWQLQMGVVLVYLFGVGMILMLVYWTVMAVKTVGTVSSFIELTYQEWSTIRRLWPAQKPFTGARLLYTGFISVVIYAASGLAIYNSDRTTADSSLFSDSVRLWLVLLLIGLLPLMILPLLVSQRILVATAIVAGIITYTMISSRGMSLKIPIIGALAGFGVWTAQEMVRTGFAPDGLTESMLHSTNRVLFYFTNNIGNLNRVVASVPERSYGFRSFRFVFRYLFIDDIIKTQYLDSFYSSLALYKGGGPVPALGVPYLDFGILGLFLIFGWGYIAQLTYLKAPQSLFASQVYGLVAATIVLSWHTALWGHVVFWTNVGLLFLFVVFVPRLQLIRSRRKTDRSTGTG